MPTLFERLAARLAYIHAQRVFGGFIRALGRVDAEQTRVLRRVLSLVAESDFGRRHGLRNVRTVADLRRAVPLMTYEDYRPYVDRVCDGDTGALFSPRTRVLMLATSSGTTAQPKRVPVTPAFVADYRRGWNIFGLKMLTDHPRAILRAILQSSAREDAGRTACGIPCGAITGLLARTQKSIVRRFYVGRPEVAYLDEPRARYYTLMRLGIVRDVAFAITASPATLIQMARTADEECEILIRDVRDGTLSSRIVSDPGLRAVLSAGLRPNPGRADELARLRNTHGVLKPRDYWRIEFLACWTGGSMGYYLRRLADWWGPVPVRDVGLLASEGRVSVPLEDGTPAGVLDITSNVFEFIPLEQAELTTAKTVTYDELESGHDYVVVLTNASGLLRYRLDDVVRVHGRLRDTPIVEFLHRAGRVASVAGEKLTEHQVVAAVNAVVAASGAPEFDFVMAPCWGDPPYYRITCGCELPPLSADALDAALCEQNEEYASRRKSGRLGMLCTRMLSRAAFAEMDRKLIADCRSTAEQYKRPCLFTEPGADERILGAQAI
jgi:hypothetical protein